jgi:Rho-associated protein kinase 1
MHTKRQYHVEFKDFLLFDYDPPLTQLYNHIKCNNNIIIIITKLIPLMAQDRFPEDMARFYTAEMVLALQALHTLGFVHRYG